jgi:hypothetical protein
MLNKLISQEGVTNLYLRMTAHLDILVYRHEGISCGKKMQM